MQCAYTGLWFKRYLVGDAQVSEKHSGFIINKKNASAKDILDLIKLVQQKWKKNLEYNLVLKLRFGRRL